MNYSELNLEDLQKMREETKGKDQKAAINAAIDNIFLPPKPRKQKKKKEKRFASSMY